MSGCYGKPRSRGESYRDDEPRDDEPNDDEPRSDEPNDDEPRSDEPRDDEPKVESHGDDDPIREGSELRGENRSLGESYRRSGLVGLESSERSSSDSKLGLFRGAK
jgi:hypothetical protein